MNDIANSTSAAAIAAATASPQPALAVTVPASVTTIPAAPVAVESPIVASPCKRDRTQAGRAFRRPPLAEARPAHEFQPSILDEATDPLPQAKDAPVDPAQPPAAPVEKDAAPVQPTETPIVYEFAYPEGFQKENLDQERFSEFTSLLNETRVPLEKAQKYMDMHLQEVTRAQIAALDHVWRTHHRQQNEWKNEIKNHPELGGENLRQTKAEANAFIEQYGGSPEEQAKLRTELTQTGMGNSPRLVAAMKRAGIALSREGRPVVSPPPRQAPPSRQQRGLQRYQSSGTPGSS